MKISVIMPSYLGHYDGAAKNREQKFFRAVDSFLLQSQADKELIIVSDGCKKTKKLFNQNYLLEPNIRLIEIEKQELFSGNVRQAGLDAANGNVVCYLDTDDFLGSLHLETIAIAFINSDIDWCYWSSFYYFGKSKSNLLVEANLAKGNTGTSCIAHKKNLPDVFWYDCHGYQHDWRFIEHLIRSNTKHKKIYNCSYNICHRPNNNHDN